MALAEATGAVGATGADGETAETGVVGGDALRDWLTTREVADELRVSERTVRRMIDSGEMHAYRVRGSLRVTRADFAAWQKGARVQPVAHRRRTRKRAPAVASSTRATPTASPHGRDGDGDEALTVAQIHQRSV